MSPLKAALLASLERYFAFAAAFVTSIIISRLLTPSEVGTFSVAMAITGIAGVIREFGAASFIVRAPTIDVKHESCAFGLSMLMGWSIGGLLLIVAPFIGPLFRNDSVTPILQLLSLNFFLVPFGTVQSSLLQRAMRFDVLTRIGIASALVSMTTSIGLAWLGFGAYALAFGAISMTLTASMLSILWGPAPWFRAPRLRDAHELLTFGLQSTGLSMVWEINARFPDFVLGHAQGMHAAGLLSRASSLVSNVNDVLMRGIGTVALPYLSQIQRDSGNANGAHLRMASIVTGLGIPFFGALAYLATPITLILYGEQWLEITTALQLICLAYALALPFSFQLQLIIAKGCLGAQLKASLGMLLVRFIIVGSGAYLGGLNGLAVATVIAHLVSLWVGSVAVWPLLGVTWRDYAKVISENGLIILITLASVIIFEIFCKKNNLSHILEIILYSILLGTLLLTTLWCTNHPLSLYLKRLRIKL